jgi:hypothetical protein
MNTHEEVIDFFDMNKHLPQEHKDLLKWFQESYAHFVNDLRVFLPNARFDLSPYHFNASKEEAAWLKKEILFQVDMCLFKDSIVVDFFYFNHMALCYFALNSRQ